MPGLAGAFERIGVALEHFLPVTHAGGAALAVTDGEEILGVVVRGMADVASGAPVRPETRFEIGSISKSFAAIVAMQEAEAGRLDLHVSVNDLLPWLELPEPFGPITMHHLLTHTSGLAIGTEDAPTGLGAATNLRDLPPTFAPGEHFSYSNDGYKVVGLVLERVTGMPIHELLHARLLGPLGMRSSVAAITEDVRADLAVGYEPMFTDRPPQLRHPLLPAAFTVSNTADGSIVSNVIDMCAYARLVLNRGDVPDGRGGRILSDAGFETLTTRRVDVPEEPDLGYGYGLDVGEVGGRRRIAHAGGMVGYTAYLVTEPDEGLGCVILQNGSGGKEQVVGYALDAVRASIAGDELPEPWTPRDPEETPDAAGFAGRYEGDRRTFEIAVVEGNRLRLTIGPVATTLAQDPLEKAGDAFLVPHASLERFPLRFGRDGDGRVVEAFHGDEWFRGDDWAGPDPDPVLPLWQAYAGLYRNDDPWAPVLRVVIRKGKLALQWPTELIEEELTPLDDGWFSAGETWTPCRIRFEDVIDGEAAVAVYNGGRWYRSFEE